MAEETKSKVGKKKVENIICSLPPCETDPEYYTR